MAHNIQQANDLIKKRFPENWWVQYDFDKATDAAPLLENKANEFKKQLIQVEDQLFDFLNYSLLSGEYCQHNDFEKELNSTKELLRILYPEALIPPADVQKVLQENFREDFIEPLKLAVNIYWDFYASVRHRIIVSSTAIAFAHHEEITAALESKKYTENSKNNLSFWSANVAIARQDHFMTHEDQPHKFLFRLSRELNKKLNVKPYAPVLKSKCNFLIAKVLIRLRKEDEAPIYILKNSIEEEFNVQDFDDSGIFKKEFDYILTHYEVKDGWDNYVAKDFDLNKQLPFKAMTVRQLHRSIKYFKDINPSIKRLQAIRAELQNRFNTAHASGNSFDYYSYAVALNYTINNEFSLLCDSEKTTPEDAESLYQTVIELQQFTGIKNFFPQTKYLNFLLNNLNEFYEKKKAFEFVGPCREIIDKSEDLFDSYEANVKWSTRNYNYVFQLPPEECFYDTRSEHVPRLFIFSTFMLPLPRQKYQDEFESESNEVGQWRSSIDVFENVQEELSDLKRLKKDLTHFQSEMRNKDVRTLEVLGVFTAIVTFLASSIPAFKFIENAVDALLFMFALACSLGIFVLVLLAINKGADTIRKNRGLIFAIMTLAVILWTVLICSDKRVTDPINSTPPINDARLGLMPVDTISSAVVNDSNSGDSTKIQ